MNASVLRLLSFVVSISVANHPIGTSATDLDITDEQSKKRNIKRDVVDHSHCGDRIQQPTAVTQPINIMGDPVIVNSAAAAVRPSRNEMKSVPSREILQRVFDSSPPYATNAEEKACQSMIESLTEDEQEQAACTSYAYLVASRDTGNRPSVEIRKKMAMREARRHLVGNKGDYSKALQDLKSTLKFREEKRINLIRQCFEMTPNNTTQEQPTADTSLLNKSSESLSDHQQAALFRSYIKDEMSKQLMIVRGHDKSKRSVVIKFQRHSAHIDVEGYILSHLYIAERSIATTELLSAGQEEKVVAVMDFGDYASANAPPIRAIRRLVTELQHNYPERLEVVVLADPPLWMRSLFAIIKPFMSPDTREKIRIVSGEAQKQKLLGPLISADQAMPMVLPDGQLDPSMDVNRFLYDIPFHSLYDQK